MPEVSYGDKAPDAVNVIIEIRRGERNKYEMDKDSGRLFLDRVNATMLGYPADYGYVPDTLCEDGDPVDALLIIDESVPHGSVIPSRPIGVLYFEDDGDMDEKLIVVPVDDVTQSHIQGLDDLGPNFKKVIEHFYSHYKDWKKDWTGVQAEFKGWGDAKAAKEVITQSIERYKK